MKYQFSVSDWEKTSKANNKFFAKAVDRHAYTAGGKPNVTNTVEENLLISNKTAHVFNLDPTIPLLGIYPKATSP